jgi:peroxiredoxin
MRLGRCGLLGPKLLMANEFGLTFKLSEDLRRVYGKFGIDLKKYNGDESWTLPIAARFVIDSSGTVRAVDVDPDYTVRPEPAETLRILEGLRTRGSL